MSSLRQEIEDEIQRVRLDKTKLYTLLGKLLDQCELSGGEGGGPGVPGPAGPAGPAGGGGVVKVRFNSSTDALVANGGFYDDGYTRLGWDASNMTEFMMLIAPSSGPRVEFASTPLTIDCHWP